jgi:hypothetical protein
MTGRSRLAPAKHIEELLQTCEREKHMYSPNPGTRPARRPAPSHKYIDSRHLERQYVASLGPHSQAAAPLLRSIASDREAKLVRIGRRRCNDVR